MWNMQLALKLKQEMENHGWRLSAACFQTQLVVKAGSMTPWLDLHAALPAASTSPHLLGPN